MSTHGAQIGIVVMQVIGLLILLYRDINGRPAEPPTGFSGVLTTLIVFAVFAWVYARAGLYSTFF